MTPFEKLEEIASGLHLLLWHHTLRKDQKVPGAWIARLPEEDRALLRHLSSDDHLKYSCEGTEWFAGAYDWWYEHGGGKDRDRLRRMMEQFDREVLRIDPRTLRKKY